MAVCALLLLPAVPDSGVRCGRVCWGPGFGCAPPLLGEVLLGCACGRVCALLAPALPGGRLWRGAVRMLPLVGCAPPPSPLVFFFGLGGVGRWLSGSWVSWSLSPHSFSSGPRCLLFVFFVPQRDVCPRVLGVPSPGGPLPSAWCCRFWLGGPPAPLWGVLSSVLSGWGVWPPLVVLVGGVVAGGRSRAPPPCFFFFLGGSACSSLCLPWAGARTGRHSVWFSGLLLVVVFCQAVPWPHGLGGLCTRWARRPFLPGWVVALLGGRLCQAVSCGPGLAVSLRLRSAGLNFPAAACVGGPPPLSPGLRWPFAGVWRAGAVPSGVCGGLIWLDPRLASLSWCCGVLWCAVLPHVVF